MMKRIFALLITLPLLAAQETTVKKMTIKDALRASYHSDKNKAAREAVKGAYEGYVQARAGFLPKINASSSYGKQKIKDVNDPENPDGSISENRNMSVTLNQNIFNGGATLASMDSADAEIRKEWQELEKKEQESYKDAAEIYLDLIMQKKLIDVAEGNLKFVKKYYEDAEQKHKAGEETITNVESAKAEYFKGEANLESNKTDLDSKKTDFFYKTTLQAPRDLEIPDIESMLPKTLEAAQGVAESHYGLQAAKAQIDNAQAKIDQETGALMPKVDLQLGVSRGISPSSGYLQRRISDQTSTSMTVQASIPLYEGGEIRSKVRQAAQSKTQARLSLESLKIQLKTQVTQAWIAVNNQRSTVNAYRKVVEASKLAVNSLVEEQKAGSKTLLEVLDQQRKLFENQSQLINAENKYHKACFGLLGAMGILNDKGMSLNIENKFDKQADYANTKRTF